MIGRYFFLGVIALGLAAYMHGQHSTAATGTVTQACANASASAATADRDLSPAETPVAAIAPVPPQVTATIGWTAPGSAADELWFDLSLASDFRDGLSSAHGPLASNAASFTSDVLASGVRYYYRVNALRSGKWHIVAAGSLVAECPKP